MRLFSFFLFLCVFPAPIFCQNHTVGLFQNTPSSFDGYTLFSPSAYTHTYLIDNCGRKVHEWESDYRATSSYLLENGNLLRVAIIPNAFNSGGTAGRLELFDWESNLLWGYNYSTLAYHQHHDIEPLPNGNILLVAWERHSREEAIENGRDSLTVGNDGLWSERVVEIRPIGSDSAEIVWMWRVWDHLIQDFDATKLNYGNVAQSPQLFDINFRGVDQIQQISDWLHVNSIDYNPNLDQIMLSSRVWSEVWVIDHSTTTASAATHTGGNVGNGGDILFRWGNPWAYKRGTITDQKFFGQHDAHWVQDGRPDAGKILTFNNGVGRPTGIYSSFDLLTPPLQADGSYILLDTLPFGPIGLDWTYDANFPFDSYFSPTVSGVQQQPNGTFLGCIGRDGIFVEVNAQGEKVWEYVSPVRASGPAAQGTNIGGNTVFKINRYAPDYQGFLGKALNPGDPIELLPLFSDCEIFSGDSAPEKNTKDVMLSPNPASDYVKVESGAAFKRIDVFDVYGRLVQSLELPLNKVEINVSDWPTGFYYLVFDKIATTKLMVK